MKKTIALLLALCLLLTGCAGKAASSQDLMKGVKPSGQDKGLSAADGNVPETDEVWDNALIADFGLRLFRAAFVENQNTLLSPVSLLAALGMAANGGSGETLAQMEAVLGQSTDALNSWYKYGTGYRDDVLCLANGIWFREDPSLTVKEEFLQKNADYYGAGLYKAPFDETTLLDINSFVEEHTNGMIKDILDEIPREAVMYLVNALAFDAQWQEIYKENQVHDGTFTTEFGTPQDVQMMWSEENRYLENDLATGFIKLYGPENGRYAFAALLPKENVTLRQLLESLDGKQLQSLLANPQRVTVQTAIPKFETEYDTEMSELLAAMGMPDAFDSGIADFSGLGTSADGNIYLSRVIHKTFISVAEKGTKAGAATVVEAACESALEMEEIKEVILNRPFLYMIVDTLSNTPIFMGTMVNNGEEEAFTVQYIEVPGIQPAT